jgi:hypothetical protein
MLLEDLPSNNPTSLLIDKARVGYIISAYYLSVQMMAPSLPYSCVVPAVSREELEHGELAIVQIQPMVSLDRIPGTSAMVPTYFSGAEIAEAFVRDNITVAYGYAQGGRPGMMFSLTPKPDPVKLREMIEAQTIFANGYVRHADTLHATGHADQIGMGSYAAAKWLRLSPEWAVSSGVDVLNTSSCWACNKQIASTAIMCSCGTIQDGKRYKAELERRGITPETLGAMTLPPRQDARKNQ